MSLYNYFWLIVIYEYMIIIFYLDNKYVLKFFLLVFVFSEKLKMVIVGLFLKLK